MPRACIYVRASVGRRASPVVLLAFYLQYVSMSRDAAGVRCGVCTNTFICGAWPLI